MPFTVKILGASSFQKTATIFQQFTIGCNVERLTVVSEFPARDVEGHSAHIGLEARPDWIGTSATNWPISTPPEQPGSPIIRTGDGERQQQFEFNTGWRFDSEPTGALRRHDWPAAHVDTGAKYDVRLRHVDHDARAGATIEDGMRYLVRVRRSGKERQ